MDRVSFAQLFNALPSPHMLLDTELRFVAVNRAYEIAVMRSEDELRGRDLFEAFPNVPEIEQRLRTSLTRVVETAKPDTLAYIHYRIDRPAHLGGGHEDRYWTAIHTPLFDAGGNVIFILQNTVDITELVRLRENASVPFRILPGELELVQRAREAELAHGKKGDESSSFARLFERAPSMIAVLQGPSHVFAFANEAYRRFFGNRNFVGRSVLDVIPEARDQGFVALLDEIFAGGVPHVGHSNRILLRGPDGRINDERFIDFSYHPIRDEKDAINGVFVQCMDRTENVLFEQRQRMMVDELNHRVKNTLSSVQSIARQTLKVGTTPEVARRSFEARLQALSKAHNALSERHWQSVDLKTIALQELAVYEPIRVAADGPLVRLSPKAAIAFAMVFHELASNAAKYGSLASDNGGVEIGWLNSPEGGIDIEWREFGVDLDDHAFEPGFGIRMLERIVRGELDGDLDLAFSPRGFICRIHVAQREVEDVAGIASR